VAEYTQHKMLQLAHMAEGSLGIGHYRQSHWMFKVSASLEHACLQPCSRLRKFWTALATGFWGRSFQIISSLVWSSSIVNG